VSVGADFFTKKMSDSESASDDGDAEDRMRDLLASYYGMQDKGDQAGGSVKSGSSQSHNSKGGNSAATSQSQIDDNSFEPKAYVRQLLKTSPLDALLRRNDELVHEVHYISSRLYFFMYF
jgi:hypothetical protein